MLAKVAKGCQGGTRRGTGRVGGPDGDETVVTCLTVGNDETDMTDVNLIMDIGDMRAMLYNFLRATHHTDPVSKELYEAFKKIFEAQHEKKKAEISTDPAVPG